MDRTSSQTNNAEIIKTLFSGSVNGIILDIDDYTSCLNPDEIQLVESASDKRKREFSTGRYCAKELLRSQGILNATILPGENREPIWPAGITGSISHCKDLCGAAIAKTSTLQSIGFDIENIKVLKNDIGRIVCTREEKDWISRQDIYDYNLLVLLVFSLKESLYKCIYQHTKIKIGFKDCTITPNLASNSAELNFKRKDINPYLQVGFFMDKKHIYTGAFYQ